MIAVDTNILVYAHRGDSQFHRPAAAAIAGLVERREEWAVPWSCFHEFFSTVTHPRVYDPPSTIVEALEAIERWLEVPTFVPLSETDAYWPLLRSLVVTGQIMGPKVHDARIAAICLQHGVSELWSADRDFGRFPALKVVNPLVA